MSPGAGEPGRPVRLAAFLPQYCDGVSTHSYAMLSLCEHMRGPGLEVELHVPASAEDGIRPYVHAAIPGWMRSAYYRADREGRLAGALSARRFRAALAGADLAYVWAGTPEPVYLAVKEAGVPLVVERVNCHRATSVPILEEAYRRAGVPASHGITRASLEEERRKLALADWIFAPSPPVRRSLLDAGIADGHILAASYGWAAHRVEPKTLDGDAPEPAFLFVGTVCVRKGAHLLLEAWAEAGVKGRLDVCGPVLPEIRAAAGHLLATPGLRTPGSVRPFSRAAATAEVFVFPTLEEGSSLAVLEAMATGLAMLTTPMGAGELIRHGREGLVIDDPYDRPAWVAALRQLAADPALRARLGAAARVRALEYTWELAGARRRDLLLAALRGRAHARGAGAAAIQGATP